MRKDPMSKNEQKWRLLEIQDLQQAFIRDFNQEPATECLLCTECGDPKRCASCGADTACRRKSYDNFEGYNLVKNVVASENRTRKALGHVDGNPT